MAIKSERSTIFGSRRAPLSLEGAAWKQSVEQITMDSCHWTGSLGRMAYAVATLTNSG